MKTNLNNYFRENKNIERGIRRTPRIICEDGFSLSVQVGKYVYSEPRDSYADIFESAEVGFPSANPDFIQEYAEDSKDLTQTVYPYTPIELIEKLIDSHGGIKLSVNQFANRPVDDLVVKVLTDYANENFDAKGN